MKKLIALTALLFSHLAYGDDGLKAYFDAAQELKQQIEQQAISGSMPRLSDARTAQLFAVLSDHRRFLHKRKYALQDLGELQRVCGKNTELLMHYMMFGTREALQGQKDHGQIIETIQILAAQNSIVYQDEIMAFLPFSVRCTAQMVPLASEFMSSLKKEDITVTRLQGIQQIKESILNMYKGALQTLVQAEIRHAHKLHLAQALAESSKQHLLFISLNNRAEIIALIKQVQETSAPDVRRLLDKVIATLSSKECAWACQLEKYRL